MLKIRHDGSIGDIIYSFPYLNTLNEKFDFYIGELSLATATPNQFISQFEIDSFHRVFPNNKNFLADSNYSNYRMCKRLFESQPYVNKVYSFKNEQIDINLNDFRKEYRGGNHLIPAAVSEYFGHNFDKEVPFLKLDAEISTFNNTCVCARSGRYRGSNSEFKWKELMTKIENESNVNRFVFIGLEKEYVDFCKQIREVEWIKTEDLYEAAIIINSCPVGMYNGSSPLAIAAGLGKLRCMECTDYLNEIPIRRNQCAGSIITGSSKEILF